MKNLFRLILLTALAFIAVELYSSDYEKLKTEKTNRLMLAGNL